MFFSLFLRLRFPVQTTPAKAANSGQRRYHHWQPGPASRCHDPVAHGFPAFEIDRGLPVELEAVAYCSPVALDTGKHERFSNHEKRWIKYFSGYERALETTNFSRISPPPAGRTQRLRHAGTPVIKPPPRDRT